MLKSNRGNAMIEVIPVLAIFVLLINFALGFFGIVHTGILNSIAARNYTFETFRNRANLSTLRDTEDTAYQIASSGGKVTYSHIGFRYHAVISDERQGNDTFYVTRRPARFSEIGNPEIFGSENHTRIKGVVEGEKASEVLGEERDAGVNPAWVRTLYGICMNSDCGG